ncbi:hypothetical protein [Deinococcus xianganensis]|uniref:Uncharacterized protein n=1 Tax=Deinococcus xianganensis TaxID=1507289 RepID=A0A6I4YJP2_9DEIO|nr:hypothetical protein [Deinococcus xianganensis]MXV20780.1 hypothetical protein [Deinococcus xianganensis]
MTQPPLTPEIILTADTDTLFLHLRPYVRMWKTDPEDGGTTQTWHMSLDGDAYADCDITLRECGHAQRSALFARALMHAATRYDFVLGLHCLGSGTLGLDYWFEATAQPREEVRTSISLCFTVRAESSELALLRAFHTYMAAHRGAHAQ